MFYTWNCCSGHGRPQAHRRRHRRLSGPEDHLSSNCQRNAFGGPPKTLMIVGPVSRYFSACARIFNNDVALSTSPLTADAASLLMLYSMRDAFFSLPRSRNSVLAFRTLSRISPTSRSQRLPRPRGLGQTPFLNCECFGGLP